MEKYIYDTSNGLWYELHGDYYIPCLALNDDDVQPIGKWGGRHLNYIRERCWKGNSSLVIFSTHWLIRTCSLWNCCIYSQK